MARTIFNLGSCCIDHVYGVPHFVTPGETLPSGSYDVFPGGKGLNQSVAIAHAGGTVVHAGCIGSDGSLLSETLGNAGVDTSLLRIGETPSGHANIQVTPEGENAIVLYGGANRTITQPDLDGVLQRAEAGDYLLLQNEINMTAAIMEQAAAAGLKIVFNAAPFTAEVSGYPLQLLDCLIVNEVEGGGITGKSTTADMLSELNSLFPDTQVVLTLGSDGAVYQHRGESQRQDAFNVDAIDTTGAGDTFTGFFLAAMANEQPVAECLRQACAAAAVSVTRAGAASSIPSLAEIADLIAE